LLSLESDQKRKNTEKRKKWGKKKNKVARIRRLAINGKPQKKKEGKRKKWKDEKISDWTTEMEKMV